MKKVISLVPLLLVSAINVAVVCLSSTQKAEAVTPSDWVGTWNCNLDGKPVQVTFREHYNLIVGNVDGNPWAVQQRNFDSSFDPPTARKDHVLPLLVTTNNTQWFLAMHTWDMGYASGFSRWEGNVYGMSCSRQ